MLTQSRPPVYIGGRHIVFSLLMIFGCTAGVGQTGRMTELPITFPTWTDQVRTSACLQVIERRYASPSWWEKTKDDDDPEEKAFKAVIVALRHKDRDALWKLSDSELGRDTKQFDQQAKILFQQLQDLEIVSVPLAYEFDGLVVFYPKFRNQEQTGSASLAFAHRQDGTFGFLPYRTKRLTFELGRVHTT